MTNLFSSVAEKLPLSRLFFLFCALRTRGSLLRARSSSGTSSSCLSRVSAFFLRLCMGFAEEERERERRALE